MAWSQRAKIGVVILNNHTKLPGLTSDNIEIQDQLLSSDFTSEDDMVEDAEAIHNTATPPFEETGERAEHDTRSACNKVLGTTDLLENILRGLDTKSLLLAQRVSKVFCAMIDDSLAIQQALFLKPSKTMSSAHNEFCFPRDAACISIGYSHSVRLKTLWPATSFLATM